MKNNSSSSSFEYSCTDPYCSWGKVEDHGCAEVNSKFLFEGRIESLEEAVKISVAHSLKKQKMCEKCGSSTTDSFTIFLVNIDFLADNRTQGLLVPSVHNRPHKLEELTQNLSLGSELRKFAGVVVHEPGHYIGYAKRTNGYWEVYNDLESHVTRVRNEWLVCSHILVYTV